ncbi:DHA2 family efflux MFS transporter permease subunit [Luteimonas salinilitoris]|uniref:DHA2 family efflux MFS transporter permease subunit n=1 Tax=Luteimonas salinilitoris TaxID=3237697 RepID=A0ABV4HPC1_9GAMM
MIGTHRLPCDKGVAHAATACPGREALSPRRKRLALAATVCGSSMTFIDGSAVNVALPAIQQDLAGSAAQLGWIVNAYLLLLGALVLVGGAAGDRYGRRRVFLVGVAVFTVASLLCALAPDARMLIAARALQGLGGALLVPNSLALLGSMFAEHERGRAVGAWAGFGALTAAAGPVLGGWLVDVLSWRAIFLLNLPLALVTVVLALKAIPESRRNDAEPLDLAGAVLAALGLGALCWSLSAAAERGLADPAVGLAALAGVAALAGFLVAEMRGRAPMMPLSLYRSRVFSGANLITLLLYFALSGALFFLPFYLILIHGYTATAAGAVLLPFSIVLGLFSGVAGRLSSRYGARLPLTFGPLLAAAGFVLMAVPPALTAHWSGVLVAVTVLAIGMTLSVAPLTTTVLDSVSNERTGTASGINNAVARVAGLLAVAAMLLLFAQVFLAGYGATPADDGRELLAAMLAGEGSDEPAARAAFLGAYRAVMLTTAACAALAGVAGWLTLGPVARSGSVSADSPG